MNRVQEPSRLRARTREPSSHSQWILAIFSKLRHYISTVNTGTRPWVRVERRRAITQAGILPPNDPRFR